MTLRKEFSRSREKIVAVPEYIFFIEKPEYPRLLLSFKIGI